MAKQEKELKGFGALSRRERELVTHAAAGLTDKQIASELGVTTNSLRTYWARIRQKTGDGTRAGVVAAFVRHNLTAQPAGRLDPLRQQGWIMDAQNRTILAADPINDDHGLQRGVPHPADAYMARTHPEDAENTRDAVFSVADGKLESAHLVFRVVTPRGIETINTAVHALRGQDGEVRKVLGFRLSEVDCRPAQDTTVRVGKFTRQYPKELWKIDEGFADILGLPGKKVLTCQDLASFMTASELAAQAELIAAAIKDGRERLENDMRLELPSGESLWFRLSRQIERKDDGSVTIHGTVNVFH